jgi:uncharacterized protein
VQPPELSPAIAPEASVDHEVALVAPGALAPTSGQLPGGPTMATLRMLNAGMRQFPTLAAADAPTGPDRMAVAFSRLLRSCGLALPLGSTVAYTEALTRVGLQSRSGVYWAGRATLVRRPEDIPTYDRVFGAFWDGFVVSNGTPAVEEKLTVGFDELPDSDESDDDSNDDDDDSDDGETQSIRFSRIEILQAKDFALYTHDDFAEAQRIISALRFIGSPRRSRRMRSSPGNRPTRRPDVRRTVRSALRTDAVPMRRSFLEPAQRPRRLVLLLDVSGSMEAYARALMRFGQAAVIGRGRVEVFALGTRLTRLTRELNSRDPDVAIGAAAKRVVDWSGGTRLGDGMRQFNDQWAIRGMARGAIVVVLSDGWDRGDPTVLGAQMERLHRVTHRLIWVNPLKAGPGYAPLARGMAAALPHLDEFIEGHSLDSLSELARLVAR